MNKRYIINNAVIPNPGTYTYQRIPVWQARHWVMTEWGFESAIGHKATAKLLSQILGVEIPANRITIYMEVGDEALVARLKTRNPQLGEVKEFSPEDLEFGVLRRIG